jgi:hypothetical protein
LGEEGKATREATTFRGVEQAFNEEDMDADRYFEFTSRCLVKQIDIFRDWMTYDRETDTFSFPADQWDILMYERKEFEKTLNSHLEIFRIYKDMYDAVYKEYEENETNGTNATS